MKYFSYLEVRGPRRAFSVFWRRPSSQRYPSLELSAIMFTWWSVCKIYRHDMFAWNIATGAITVEDHHQFPDNLSPYARMCTCTCTHELTSLQRKGDCDTDDEEEERHDEVCQSTTVPRRMVHSLKSPTSIVHKYHQLHTENSNSLYGDL